MDPAQCLQHLCVEHLHYVGRGIINENCEQVSKVKYRRWIKDKEISTNQNRTTQENLLFKNGSIVSPLLFSIEINDVFMEKENGKVLLEEGQKVGTKQRGAIMKVEQWTFKLDFLKHSPQKIITTLIWQLASAGQKSIALIIQIEGKVAKAKRGREERMVVLQNSKENGRNYVFNKAQER